MSDDGPKLAGDPEIIPYLNDGPLRHYKLERKIERLTAELAAVRTLMNTYNLGGWTDDREGPMRRALKAEAELAAHRAALVELVAMDDLNEAVNSEPNLLSTDAFIKALDDIKRRDPLAWAAARALVKP